MSFSETTTINFPVDQVFEALTSEDFYQHVADKVGAELNSFEAADNSSTGEVRTRSVLTLPAEKLSGRIPDFAQKMVSGGLKVEQENVWQPADGQGNRRGTMQVKVAAARVTADGSQELRAEGEGSIYEISGEIECAIPFVGKKVVDMAQPYISKVLSHQSRALNSWLSEKN